MRCVSSRAHAAPAAPTSRRLPGNARHPTAAGLSPAEVERQYKLRRGLERRVPPHQRQQQRLARAAAGAGGLAQPPADVDVVVIGSGIGGLSCAAMLARYGLKVRSWCCRVALLSPAAAQPPQLASAAAAIRFARGSAGTVGLPEVQAALPWPIAAGLRL
jgi:NADPH-dependent 2,4-dienoyl-CoA reductase/sulfur reductase-like enzyme